MFPEVQRFEDPVTGNMVAGERMTTAPLTDVFESEGGLGAPAPEGERVFELEGRGQVAQSELGSRSRARDVTESDVFVLPGAKTTTTSDAPDPREVHQDRSVYAQRQDSARDARITTDPETYASDPNSYDFPGVDTGPTFRREQPDFDTASFLDKIL